MFIDYTDEQKALRRKLRAYFEELLPPETRAKIRPMEGGPVVRELIRRMGRDGWLGVGWPKEYGGQGLGAVEQAIWFDEVRRADAPMPFVTLNTVGPALMATGTEEQKRRFLPAILAGEVHFAIGYSEPEAGTDLAALKTTAVRDGDHYVLNGSKRYISNGCMAKLYFIVARTDTRKKLSEGASIFVVPHDTPGLRRGFFHEKSSQRLATNVTFHLDNCRVPAANMLVGEGMLARLRS